jgi:sugar-specific transcriptional regulator TrmB
MPILENLELLGLTRNEGLVLQEFIASGESIAAEIAVKLQLDKSTVYKAADELWKKGFLVRNLKKRGTTYIPTDIAFLERKMRASQEQYAHRFGQLSSYIDELKQTALSGANKTYITVEKGYEAHKEAMRRILASKEKLVRQKLSTNHKMYAEQDYQEFMLDEYIPQRLKNGINVHILMQYSNNDYFKSINQTNEKELKEVRILSGEFANPHSFKIYDDFFDLTVYGENGMPELTISVHDSVIANMMKETYDFMWGRSPVYYQDAQLPTRKLYDGKYPYLALELVVSIQKMPMEKPHICIKIHFMKK